MGALYLTETDVEQLLDIRLAIDVVQEAFRQWAAGAASNIPRQRAMGPDLILHSMSAAAPYLGAAGWKCYSSTSNGAVFHTGIYDSDGQLAALIESNRLGRLRTGAATGVAVQWMAEPEASEVGLLGAGWQARCQLAAVAAVRPLKRAYVYSRDAARRAAFADEMSVALNLEVLPVDRPQEAAEDLPIVVTATTSRAPVFDGNHLSEGTLVCAVGSNWLNRAEIDSHVVRRADHIVCDSVEACKLEAGDFVDALQKGVFDWSRAVDLADVVAGQAVGRSHQASLCLFKSVGLAIEDVALGAKLLELARAAGRGTPLP